MTGAEFLPMFQGSQKGLERIQPKSRAIPQEDKESNGRTRKEDQAARGIFLRFFTTKKLYCITEVVVIISNLRKRKE